MGIGCPPWYGTGKKFYEKELKKAEAKLELKKIEIAELEETIKELKVQIAECEE